MTVHLNSWMPSADLPAGPGAGVAPPPRQSGRGQVQALTGNDAVALAFKQVDPYVAAAYPIAPQTELMHKFAEYVDQGAVRTELINVESEHSAMSAVLAAAAAGCRTFTATSAIGLAYMMEVYQNAAALRLPVVMSLVNRHAGGLLNIHNDHGDAMLARNAGWIQLHAEDAQEAYDNVLQAYRIAEDDRLRLPVTVCHDGFIVSHTMERLLALTDAEARSFVGEFIPPVDLLDMDNPRAVGPLVMPDLAANLYAQVSEAMRWAPAVIEEVGQEYGLLTGRSYGVIEPYCMEDAEVAVVAMGSVCGTVRAVVNLLRQRGVRAGLIKLRSFRPFPAEALARALQVPRLAALAVLDKCPELGSGGPLFTETTTALALQARAGGQRLPVLTNAILGVGGRDVTMADVNGIYRHLLELAGAEARPQADPVFFLDTGSNGPKELSNNGNGTTVQDQNITRVMFMARGGQGARTNSYLLSEMMIDLGMYAQAFPAHGAERTGAPIKTFAKVSAQPIDDRQQIYSADVMVVLDEGLLDVFDKELEQLARDGVLMVNTRRSPAEIRQRIGMTGGRIYTVDATGIAMAELGTDRPNMAMLAAIARVLDWGDLGRLGEAFRAKMKRLSDKTLQGTLRIMERARAEIVREKEDEGVGK